MRDAVRAAWVDYNKNLEGVVTGPYADILGYVTVGMGNKIDPVRDALDLPWTLVGAGRPATQDEIKAAWLAVKYDPKCAKIGWVYALGKPENNIRLSSEAISDLITARLYANDQLLKNYFVDFEEWPADAQLAAHSMVWAMGFAGLVTKFPRCCSALRNGDFAEAAKECKMTPEAGTLVTRNRLNFQLLHNAAESVVADEDPEVLVWQP
jgi:GH24 family phage-related lysozyme (muramidase)